MEKPRIIIADTDSNYIIPLQLKFVEEFFNKVDLEIITDKTYFENLFSTPQKADIVIVSENLYAASLQKHNINKIFLMTEQYEEGQTDELNVDKLFKYTSIKEVFNEIIGKSADILNIKAKKNEPQIVLVYSACGGTGKTTVSLGISACLTKNYKKVLYINASSLQSFQRMFDNQSPISATDVYKRLTNADESIYQDIKHVIRKEQFCYLPPFKAALMSLGLSGSIYGKIALSAKKSGEYDFIIIDSESVFDEDRAKLLNIADKVMVVTNQSSSAVYATNILASNINGIGADKFVFICNNFDKDKYNALISPSITLKFTINEYIGHFEHYDQMRCDDFSKDNGIQKSTVLIL